jgi:hypothetical protein
VGRYTRDLRSSIVFHDKDGNFTGKVQVREGTRGNRHVNVRRPNGPLCDCGEQWKPVCPNKTCAGNTVPRRIMRVERYGLRRHERQEVSRGRR